MSPNTHGAAPPAPPRYGGIFDRALKFLFHRLTLQKLQGCQRKRHHLDTVFGRTKVTNTVVRGHPTSRARLKYFQYQVGQLMLVASKELCY